MEAQVVSLAHGPIALREQVSFSDARKLSFYTTLQEHGISSGLILSTCNRCEVYAEVKEDSSLLYDLVLQEMGEAVTPYVTYLKKEEAMVHALRVCAGLNSTLLGEDQIFHQMKDAYAHASAAGMMSACMNRFFQTIFRLTKQCKTIWRMNEQPNSSSYVAWKLLEKQVPIKTADFLLCGGGEVMQELLPYMTSCTGQIYLAVRNQEKGKTLQNRYPFLQLIPMDTRLSYLSKVDVVISATSSPHVMFPYTQKRNSKELWMLDLALPRDIASSWQNDAHVHLYDIDQIQATLDQANKKRFELAKQAERFVEEHCTDLVACWKHQDKEPLKALTQQRLLHMAEDTYTLLDRKLNLQPHEQRIMKKTLDYSFMRVMKQLVSTIQTLDDTETNVMRRLLERFYEEDQT